MTDISKAKSILQQTGYSVSTVYVDDALLMTIRHGAEVISRAPAVVKDDAIRSKLIALGWTPPDPWTSVDDGMPPVETPVLVKRAARSTSARCVGSTQRTRKLRGIPLLGASR